MKILKKPFYLLLLGLLLSWSPIGAQTWNIIEDYAFTVPSSCYAYTVNPALGGWIKEVDITYDASDVSHPSDPNIVQNLREDAWRVVTFDIFHDNGTPGNPNLQLVKSVVFDNQHWLTNATVGLKLEDLEGVPPGQTQIWMRTYYYQTIPNPFYTNLYVNDNGGEACATLLFGDPLSNDLPCDFGMVDCFVYDPCNAELDVYDPGTCWQGPNPPNPCQAYQADVTGSSGNLSYAWTVTDGVGAVLFSGSQSYFQFFWTPNPNNPVRVALVVTDNGTGCTYFFSETLKTPRSAPADGPEPSRLELAPNPVAQGQSLEIRFVVPAGEDLSLSLYDLQGRQLKVLVREASASDDLQSLSWLPELAPGVYVLRLDHRAGQVTRKLVVR